VIHRGPAELEDLVGFMCQVRARGLVSGSLEEYWEQQWLW
jgi:hypothetical protein